VKPVIAVYQRGVMPYRRPFFELAAAALEKEGIDLTVMSADQPTAQPDLDLVHETGKPRYIELGSRFRRSVAGRDIVEQLVVPRDLWRALRETDPALIVTEDLSALPGNLQIPLFTLTKRRPYLIWTLGPAILGKRRSSFRSFATPIIAALRRPAAGFICYSRWAAEQMERAYGKPCFVAPNATVGRPAAIDLGSLPRSDGNSIRAIFIGRLTAQKNLQLLLEAAKLSTTRVEIDVIGDGEERPALERLASELQIVDRVRFHGDIRDPDRKAALIDRAHVGVMPGLGGLFVQEVQARGCPVIATAADGTEQDLVRAVNPELYLEQPDAKRIADTLSALASDPNRLFDARTAAFSAVRDDYNLERMVEGWVKGALWGLQSGKR